MLLLATSRAALSWDNGGRGGNDCEGVATKEGDDIQAQSTRETQSPSCPHMARPVSLGGACPIRPSLRARKHFAFFSRFCRRVPADQPPVRARTGSMRDNTAAPVIFRPIFWDARAARRAASAIAYTGTRRSQSVELLEGPNSFVPLGAGCCPRRCAHNDQIDSRCARRPPKPLPRHPFRPIAMPSRGARRYTPT